MKFYRIAMHFVFSLTLFACGQNQPASNSSPRANEKGTPGVCVPEKVLMAPNIVGGNIVNKGDADDKTVVLLINSEKGSICTAAPIAKDVLLTAAHCVGENPAELAAAFYPSYSCESGFNISRHAIKVAKIARHTGYDMTKKVEDRTDDVALVFLRSNIPEGYPVYKIADPQQVNEANQMFLYGYGVVGEKAGGAGFLRKATIDNGNFRIELADKRVFVDQRSKVGFCMGDSGGPGFVKIKDPNQNDELQILGINSYVKKENPVDICNESGYQTLVNSYKEWIDFQMN